MATLITIIIGVVTFYYSFKYFNKKYNNKPQNKEVNDFWYRYNNPQLKSNSRYNNHCWHCGKPIDSFYEQKCKKCGWYICSSCGACKEYPNCEKIGINKK